jgi:hypothetical protein
MSKISTKDIPVGGGSVPKVIQPGNRVLKINSVGLEKFPFKDGAYHFIFNVEGPDLGEDFEGFLVDKNDPSKGKHKGQVGKIKASEWAFSDGETKGGVKISRDREILKFMQNLCKQLDAVKWFETQDNKHDTIEGLVEKFNEDKLYIDKWLKMCVGGKEYLNGQGYTNHDLFLPKFNSKKVPFELENVPEADSKLILFSEAEHIKKKKTDTVEDFGDKKKDKKAGSDFDL